MFYHLFARQAVGLLPDPDAITTQLPAELGAEIQVSYGPGFITLALEGLCPQKPCTLTLATDGDGRITAAGPLLTADGATLPASDNLCLLYDYLLAVLQDAEAPPLNLDADGFEGTRRYMEC